MSAAERGFVIRPTSEIRKQDVLTRIATINHIKPSSVHFVQVAALTKQLITGEDKEELTKKYIDNDGTNARLVHERSIRLDISAIELLDEFPKYSTYGMTIPSY